MTMSKESGFTEKILAGNLEIGQKCLVKLQNETSFTLCERAEKQPFSQRRPIALKIIHKKTQIIRGKAIIRTGDLAHVSDKKNVLVQPEPEEK